VPRSGADSDQNHGLRAVRQCHARPPLLARFRRPRYGVRHRREGRGRCGADALRGRVGGAFRGEVLAMNRWTARVVGILMLLVFVLLMMNLQRKLLQLQQSRRAPATSTTTSR